ncbi:MAG: exosortase H [Ottowia sp.]|nr:exosortase H [Ottowia sp.]
MKRFLLTFLLIALALFGIKMLPPVQHAVVEPWTALIARASAFVVRLIDPGAIFLHGRVLYSPSPHFRLSVDPVCSGLEACIVLTAALLAFPATWGERLRGLLPGILALQTINLVRLVSLFFIGKKGGQQAYDIAHTFVWQALIVLSVPCVWLLWVRYVGNNQRRRDAERAPDPPTAGVNNHLS